VRTVDTAATQKDSLKRLAFVAAFAMSNYSSTIGRIAKPFNPMLVSDGRTDVGWVFTRLFIIERNIRICTTGQEIPLCL
jgi:hypothetical protein